jgi:Flp pilus assembly pilin Flp
MRKEGTVEPGRRYRMERTKQIPMRLYLALAALRDGEEGQAMVEYALILALVSVAAVAILSTLGHSVSSIFNEINNDL